MRTTYTYATLEVSNATYKEIIEKLREAGYSDQFVQQGNNVDIDMHGLALVTKCDHDWKKNPDNAGPMYCIHYGVRLRP